MQRSIMAVPNFKERVNLDNLINDNIKTGYVMLNMVEHTAQNDHLSPDLSHAHRSELHTEIVYLTSILLLGRKIKEHEVFDHRDYVEFLKGRALNAMDVFTAETFRSIPYYKTEASLKNIKNYLYVLGKAMHSSVDVYNTGIVWRIFFPHVFNSPLQKFQSLTSLVNDEQMYGARSVAAKEKFVIINGHRIENPKLKMITKEDLKEWNRCDPFALIQAIPRLSGLVEQEIQEELPKWKFKGKVGWDGVKPDFLELSGFNARRAPRL